MKSFIKFFFLFLGSMFISYLIGAAANWQVDPMYWNPVGRNIIFGVGGMISAILSALIILEGD